MRRNLWSSNQEYKLDFTYGFGNACQFELLQLNKLNSDEQASSAVILRWAHEIKVIENICFICTSEEGQERKEGYLLKILWHANNVVYCDFVTLNERLQTVETEPILSVSFNISFFHIVWSLGIIFLEEDCLGNLHIFDTGHDHYLGYITLYTNALSIFESGSMIKFDSSTSTLWAIVRKYDEVTKTSSIFLNTYNIPKFTLETSINLPRGYSRYGFVKLEKDCESEPYGMKATEGTVLCSSCELLQKSVIQRFLSPAAPWKESHMDYLVELECADHDSGQSYLDYQETNFQPIFPLYEIRHQNSH